MIDFLDAATRLAEILTWPIVVLVSLLVFRRPLSAFVAGLGSRVTKLSVFKIELELATTEAKAPSVVLNQLRDTTQAAVADSARSLFTQLRDATPADFAVIDLGTGDDWITSRLFIAAALLERMRGLRAMVFVESRQPLSEHFLAVAAPSAVRWALARRYPWLELAYAQATERAMVAGFSAPPGLPGPTPKDFAGSDTILVSECGALAGDRAESLAREFLASIQDFVGNPPPPFPEQWVELSGYRERASRVTSRLLRELLPSVAFDPCMNEMRDDPQARRVRAVLRRPGSFVALLDADQRFKRLVDRGILLEEAALQLGAEPS